MKIAYITMLFPAPAEVFAVNDVRALEELGNRVSVHCLRPETPECGSRLEEHGLGHVPVTYCTGRSVVRGVAAAIRQPRLALELLTWTVAHNWRRAPHLVRSLVLLPRVLEIVEELRRSRPDVIHLFWGHYPALVGALAARSVPGAILSIFLGAYDLAWNFGGSGPVARAADIVWTHAEVNVPLIRELGVARDRIRVVHRGLNLRAIPPRYRRPVSGRRLITVGRLIPEKAFDDVLAVFAEVRRRWEDSTLVVIGDGPDRRRLERMARELGVGPCVSFTGHLPHARVLEQMTEADVMVFLSRKESERLPNVVKEAMACGCVCVASDTPGLEALVTHGVTGYVVAPGDLPAAVECIDSIFRDPDAARAMTERACAHVVENFDVLTAMRAYHRAWDALQRGVEPRERLAAGAAAGTEARR